MNNHKCGKNKLFQLTQGSVESAHEGDVVGVYYDRDLDKTQVVFFMEYFYT